jgi:hypothetical protein
MGGIKNLATPGVPSYLQIAAMKANIAYWRSCLRDAECELEAAATRTAINAAASRVMLAKMKLKQLQPHLEPPPRHLRAPPAAASLSPMPFRRLT